jgi:hypothetical protein
MTTTTKNVLAMAMFVAALCCAADAYRYSVFLSESSVWAPPAGSSDISVTLWGAGGGGASTSVCGAGGGSGAAILNRTVGDAAWSVPPSSVDWVVVVGQGGAGLRAYSGTAGTAGNGGNTVLMALDANGTALFTATAYGGGGAYASFPSRTQCHGGGGGGSLSAASGPTPGSGNPPGAADADPLAGAVQGATVGDVKAGGAGAGYGYNGGNLEQPFIQGAPWTSPGRDWPGGTGVNFVVNGRCISWGGAAGFNGKGGRGAMAGSLTEAPPANSGSGGGSGTVCPPGGADSLDMTGAAGGIIIEYNHPIAPTPSNTPSPSVTPSRTPSPSVTPSSTPQPLSQYVTFVSPITGRHLTAQDNGAVASLWVNPTIKEKWTVTRLANGKYTVRAHNGRYLSAHAASPDGYVRCESTSVGAAEQWTMLIAPGNEWTFKSTYNTYMGTTSGGTIYLNNVASLYWTKYDA